MGLSLCAIIGGEAVYPAPPRHLTTTSVGAPVMAKITLSPEERAAKREYQRQYRLKNAEKLLTNRREWRKKNKERIHGYYEKHKKSILDKNREWVKDNPEKVSAIHRRSYEKNREKRAAYSHRYYEINKEEILAYQRQWVKENPETVRAMQRRWRGENPEKVRATFKKWVQNNPDAYQAALQRYKEKDPDAYRAFRLTSQRNREARKLQQMPQWVIYEELLTVYANCPAGMHVDHIIPLRGITFEGNPVSGLHLPWNLQFLTPLENSKKHNRMRREDHVACGAPIDSVTELSNPR